MLYRHCHCTGGSACDLLAKIPKDDVDLPVTQPDFLESLKNVCRSVGTEDLQTFVDWMKEFGSA